MPAQSAAVLALDAQIILANKIVQSLALKNQFSYTIQNADCHLTFNNALPVHIGHPNDCKKMIDGFVLGYLVGMEQMQGQKQKGF